MKDKALTLQDFREIIINTEKAIRQNTRLLCELDAVVGDGDHGSTIARGLASAVETIEKEPPGTISDLLVNTGNAMIENMGGASGPIFGSLFKYMGKTAEGSEQVDLELLVVMYEKSAEKIMKLGQAQPGDKTLLDSLLPGINALKKSCSNGDSLREAYKAMAEAAEKGVLTTKEMVANKGRSRYAGQRGIGHQDAGATSVAIMLKAASITVNKMLIERA